MRYHKDPTQSAEGAAEATIVAQTPQGADEDGLPSYLINFPDGTSRETGEENLSSISHPGPVLEGTDEELEQYFKVANWHVSRNLRTNGLTKEDDLENGGDDPIVT